MRLRHRHKKPDSDLDITSFLNLMIILVPVLLVMMVFSRITVIDLQLPDINAGSSSVNQEQQENDQLEVVLGEQEIRVNYPSNVLLKTVAQKNGEHDFELLSLVLQQVKRELRDNGKDKKDILLLSMPETPYQTIVTAYDTLRSYKAVVAASVVDAELFPDISLGDAPLRGAAR